MKLISKPLSRVAAVVLSLALLVPAAACHKGAQNAVSTTDTAQKTEVTTEVRVGALIGPTGVSMAKIATEGKTFADAYTDDTSSYVNTYKTDYADEPTQMVAKISSGELDIACVPTNLAAKLYKVTKGNIRTAAVSTLGVLYLVDTSGQVSLWRKVSFSLPSACPERTAWKSEIIPAAAEVFWNILCSVHQTSPVFTALQSASRGAFSSSSSRVDRGPSMVLL